MNFFQFVGEFFFGLVDVEEFLNKCAGAFI